MLAESGGKTAELMTGFTTPSLVPDVGLKGTEMFVSPGKRRFSLILEADVGAVVVPDVETGVFLLVVVVIATFTELAAIVEAVCGAGFVLLLSRAGKSSGWRVAEIGDAAKDCKAACLVISFAELDSFLSCLGLP